MSKEKFEMKASAVPADPKKDQNNDDGQDPRDPTQRKLDVYPKSWKDELLEAFDKRYEALSQKVDLKSAAILDQLKAKHKKVIREELDNIALNHDVFSEKVIRNELGKSYKPTGAGGDNLARIKLMLGAKNPVEKLSVDFALELNTAVYRLQAIQEQQSEELSKTGFDLTKANNEFSKLLKKKEEDNEQNVVRAIFVSYSANLSNKENTIGGRGAVKKEHPDVKNDNRSPTCLYLDKFIITQKDAHRAGHLGLDTGIQTETDDHGNIKAINLLNQYDSAARARFVKRIQASGFKVVTLKDFDPEIYKKIAKALYLGTPQVIAQGGAFDVAEDVELRKANESQQGIIQKGIEAGKEKIQSKFKDKDFTIGVTYSNNDNSSSEEHSSGKNLMEDEEPALTASLMSR